MAREMKFPWEHLTNISTLELTRTRHYQPMTLRMPRTARLQDLRIKKILTQFHSGAPMTPNRCRRYIDKKLYRGLYWCLCII